MPDHDRGPLPGASLARHMVASQPALTRHLTRGAVGFGLIGSAIVLMPSVGPAALLLAASGMVALRGCPTCWIVGLLQAISAGRLQRRCTDTGCSLGREPVRNDHR